MGEKAVLSRIDGPLRKWNTVKEIVNDGLCTGCGTCAGMCPNGAIVMHVSEFEGLYFPNVEEKRCRKCNLCVRVCPGHLVNFKELNLNIFRKEPENVFMGNHSGCYLGFSNDEDVRYNSSSGGIATQLLLFALEKHVIDGALVVRMKKDKPLEPEVLVAKTKDEILSASKSKYCPVPLNGLLKRILEEDGKFAVVGLPCHIHGIRKSEMISKRLAEKMAFHIGLFCSHTRNFKGTDFVLNRINVHRSDVVELEYRGRGWPGGMSIRLKGGCEKFIPYHEYYPILGSFFFTSQRCVLCADVTNEFADISLGDAWLPEFRNDQKGTSLIITRSEIGEKILKGCCLDNKISLMKTSLNSVMRSQKRNMNFKKMNLRTRLRVWSSFGNAIPLYEAGGISFGSSFSSWFGSLLCYVIIRVSQRESSLNRFLLFWYDAFTRLRLLLGRFFFRRFSPYWR